MAAMSGAVVIDDNAGYWFRYNSYENIPYNRYPEGLTMRVTSARAMHDPKDKKNNIQVFEVNTFDKGVSEFKSNNARSRRWKTMQEFEKLSSDLSGELSGATAPVIAPVMSARSERSPILLEERRVAVEGFLTSVIKIWFTTKNHKFREILVRWLNNDYDVGYVPHINALAGVDLNTSEFIDPADAKTDKEDSMFSAIKVPKMSMPSFGKLSMPKLGMPDIGKLSLPNLPSLGDTPADVARCARGAAGALEERKENQMAYLDASFNEQDRQRHEKARHNVHALQNGNGWVYWDEASQSGDHFVIDRELQTLTRSIKTSGLLSDNEKKTVYYWDEPIFISGDIFDLPLTKSQSKPGITNWNAASDSDIKVIRFKTGDSNNDRQFTATFMGVGGAAFAAHPDGVSTSKTFKDGPEHA